MFQHPAMRQSKPTILLAILVPTLALSIMLGAAGSDVAQEKK
jgi:hypothetical protein